MPRPARVVHPSWRGKLQQSLAPWAAAAPRLRHSVAAAARASQDALQPGWRSFSLPWHTATCFACQMLNDSQAQLTNSLVKSLLRPGRVRRSRDSERTWDGSARGSNTCRHPRSSLVVEAVRWREVHELTRLLCFNSLRNPLRHITRGLRLFPTPFQRCPWDRERPFDRCQHRFITGSPDSCPFMKASLCVEAAACVFSLPSPICKAC